MERDICDISAATGRLRKSNSELVEFQLVLERAGQFFDEARHSAIANQSSQGGSNGIDLQDVSIEAPLMPTSQMWTGSSETYGVSRLGFIAGLVPHAKLAAFERIMFRAMRGNMFLKTVRNTSPLKWNHSVLTISIGRSRSSHGSSFRRESGEKRLHSIFFGRKVEIENPENL